MADIKNTFSTGLVSHWKLEETSGTRYDAHTSGNNLTDNNTVLYGSGVSTGNAADFDRSTSEYLSIADASQTGLDGLSAMTVSAWVKLETGSSRHPVLTKDASQPNRCYAFGINYTPGDAMEFLVSSDGTNGGTGQANILIGSSLSTGTWYHFVWVFKGSGSNNCEGFFNGSSIGTGTIAPTSIHNNGSEVRMGAWQDVGTAFLDGLVDEVTVWNVALNSTQISTLYNSGTPLDYETVFAFEATSNPKSRRPIHTKAFTAKHLPTILHRPTPAHLFPVSETVVPSTVTASWSTVAPTITFSGSTAPATQSASWSVDSYALLIGGIYLVPVSTVTASWSTVAPSFTFDMIFSQSTVPSATWSTVPRQIEGSFWNRKYNVSDSFWSNKY